MKWLHGRTSGVFAAGGNAAVEAVQNSMAVKVSDGVGWMANEGQDGVVWWNDSEAVGGAKLQLSIDSADSVLDRIDRVIVEWKTTNYVDYPQIIILKGTASSTPTNVLTLLSAVLLRKLFRSTRPRQMRSFRRFWRLFSMNLRSWRLERRLNSRSCSSTIPLFKLPHLFTIPPMKITRTGQLFRLNMFCRAWYRM